MKALAITFSGALLALSFGCASQRAENPSTTRSAAIGAATGAVIGGIVGHQSGEAGAGAAIGAVAGGVAGGAYGNQKDRQGEIVHSGGSSADLPPTGYSTPYGPSSSDYLGLMTSDEVDILEARANNSRRSSYELTDFLTEEEKANLQRRKDARREIGR